MLDNAKVVDKMLQGFSKVVAGEFGENRAESSPNSLNLRRRAASAPSLGKTKMSSELKHRANCCPERTTKLGSPGMARR